MSDRAVQEVPVEALVTRRQVRESIDEEGLAELTQSIREHGILQPLLAHREGSKLVLDDGHRRLAAAKRLGLATVATIVDPRQLETAEIIQRQLVANVQRCDLNHLEKARAIDRLMKETKWTAKEVADKLGMSASTVSKLLRLLELPDSVQEKIEADRIPLTTAYEIARADGAEAQEQLAAEATTQMLGRDAVAEKRRDQDAGFTGKEGRRAASRVLLKLGAGRIVIVAGPALASIDLLVEWIEELLSRAKRVKNRGVELATFVRLLADEAKAGPGAKP
jgi:ParB family chromosome partitioning protein